MNICIQVLTWTYVFIFHSFISWTGIVKSHGNSMFNHLRKCQTFPNVYTNLYSN